MEMRLDNNLNNAVTYQQFFHAFGYEDNDTVYLRSFSDKVKDAGQNYSVKLQDIESMLSQLHTVNTHDRGIFFVVNGDGQTDKEVKHARAQFAEIDDKPIEEQARIIKEFPLEPSIIIKTRKSLHAYWLLENGETKYFRELQERMIQHFGSDPVVKNLSRVMRLYGFEHRKEEPVLVTLIKFDPEIRYTQRQLHEALPGLKVVQNKGTAVGKSSGELIPYGQRHDYVVRRCSEFVNSMRNHADAETIYAAVETDFLQNCVQEPPVEMDKFREEFLKLINDMIVQNEETEADTEFWSYAVQAWKHYTGAKKFDSSVNSWDEVQAAGIRAKTEGLQFEMDIRPEDFTDLEQARVFVRLFHDRIAYTPATRWLVFNGRKWEESEQKARGAVQQFVSRQKRDAKKRLYAARKQYDAARESRDREAEREARMVKADAENYFNQVLKYQNTTRIAATLTEATPAALIDVKKLDADPYLLNTPDGTIDLRTGICKEHDYRDYCTKMTACSCSDTGKELWESFLEQITGGDHDLQDYLQVVAGMAAIGEVKQEQLQLHYGGGGNGKSTYDNVIAMVLGDYTGHLSAETLTVDVRKNSSPEIAELRGKRLVIAAELKENSYLDTSVVKKLCSTDIVQAEKKYKDPFSFKPSHTVILFTNHLPKVGTIDSGTWDRLIVVPFTQRFRNTDKEIKNYAQVLFEQAGGAVLQWIVDGAKRFIESDFKIEPPECVKKAIAEYRRENDWFRAFLDACCEIGTEHNESADTLQTKYRVFCAQKNEQPHSAGELRKALEDAGFTRVKTRFGYYYRGLRFKSVTSVTDDS